MIYSGTCADAMGLAYVVGVGADENTNPRDRWYWFPYFVLDLPFSLVADTVLLPLTVYEQASGKRVVHRKQKPAPQKRFWPGT
jgi:uncharacterized protein YceK